jgi:cytochrome c peroxidase
MSDPSRRASRVYGTCASALVAFGACTPAMPPPAEPQTETPARTATAAASQVAAPVSPPGAEAAKPPPFEATDSAKVSYLKIVDANSPEYFKRIHALYLSGPWPNLKSSHHGHGDAYDQGQIPPVVPQSESDVDTLGKMGCYQPGGPTTTATNAFFQELGTNGRTCATCHQPPSGMSVSVDNINSRYRATHGTDPIFAPIDGSNCPNLVDAASTSVSYIGNHMGEGKGTFEDSHSLLLKRGLFRIFLAVPDGAEYTIKVVSDPYGCNTSPSYNPAAGGGAPDVVSVYRRPLISGNLKFVLNTRVPGPDGGSGNIMWDGREPNLAHQATDATNGHAQAQFPPTAAQVDQIVAFESGIYCAQVFSKSAHSLTDAGAQGGPIDLAGDPAPAVSDAGTIPIYGAWAKPGPSVDRARQAVVRGEAIFNGQTKTFTISNVAGLNDIPAVGNPLKGGSCSTCHNQVFAGTDGFPSAQHDLGIGGDLAKLGGPSPSTELPIFELTCSGGKTTTYNGSVVRTNDPGLALITGKCADIGKLSVAPLRALAGHAPYFSDGSAKALVDVVDFYKKRFSIQLSDLERSDLVAFLGSL